MVIVGIFIAVAFALSIAIGLLWNKDWWKYALAFWVPFAVFYTTIFTNTDGFFTGVVGSLGYWLAQQGVQRGSQPWYYYILIEIPIYEFLPLLGAFAALIIAIRRRSAWAAPHLEDGTDVTESVEQKNFPNTVSLLIWWIVASFVAFSVAGEKMPWLTFHVAWPLILFAAWGIGYIIDTTDWRRLRQEKALLVLAAVFMFFTSFAACVIVLVGPTPPFQGKDLDQLQATGAFVLPAVVAIACASALVYLLRTWSSRRSYAYSYWRFLRCSRCSRSEHPSELHTSTTTTQRSSWCTPTQRRLSRMSSGRLRRSRSGPRKAWG